MTHPTDHHPHPARPVHVPANNNSGWGVIAGVIVLAIVLNAWSFWVHKSSYRHPLHPSAQEPNSGGAGH